METNWKDILSKGIHTYGDLEGFIGPYFKVQPKVIENFPVRINKYFLTLIKEPLDPLWRQVIPSDEELDGTHGCLDPLDEESNSPVPFLIHRYENRVVLLVSTQCGVYCRFCNRRRFVGKTIAPSKDRLEQAISYIKKRPEINDVLISGGDPLILDDYELLNIIENIRSIDHVKVIRIGTRLPCVLPQRITRELAKSLGSFKPIFINIHFNHPAEITREVEEACGLLADHGIPLGSQTVLLKGVNDNPEVLKELFFRLLTIRVRPYYLFQMDMVMGTRHFWTPIREGIRIMEEIYGHVSGLCVPHYAFDLPQGGGKVLLTPNYVKAWEEDAVVIRNYLGANFVVPLK